jgi:deoxyribodipyrimidine photo-lyase
MSRDQRVKDNWALIYSQQEAIARESPLIVAFCLVPSYLNANSRHYEFMLRGLQFVENDLQKKNISFILLQGDPVSAIPSFLKKVKAGMLVTDFDPIRIKCEWRVRVAAAVNISVIEVDAHNIVPCRVASSKAEYGARTLRSKLRRLVSEYLIEFPKVRRHPFSSSQLSLQAADWNKAGESIKAGRSAETSNPKSGERAASRHLAEFISAKLSHYAMHRNDPVRAAQSGLSVYLHFGQISAQRVALEVMGSGADKFSRDAFLEELIVRRELSDNFCFYNTDYDKFEGFPQWAQKTLNNHRSDKREFLYELRFFEHGETHDELWNAAQQGMVKTGGMHGYMRMYWAKKILEWTASPEEAIETAIYLNDKYQLDGRDPNGYAGIAWSIGGVHDRAWGERPVFGKIRYMSYAGCKSKFNVKDYIRKIDAIK